MPTKAKTKTKRRPRSSSPPPRRNRKSSPPRQASFTDGALGSLGPIGPRPDDRAAFLNHHLQRMASLSDKSVKSSDTLVSKRRMRPGSARTLLTPVLRSARYFTKTNGAFLILSQESPREIADNVENLQPITRAIPCAPLVPVSYTVLGNAQRHIDARNGWIQDKCGQVLGDEQFLMWYQSEVLIM